MQTAALLAAYLGRRPPSLGRPLWWAGVVLAAIVFVAALALGGLLLPAPETVLVAPFRW